ncbi:MAG: hypothetical protein LBK82_16145 [Planctomycetaceae bacterium]|jgi:hypothetical protein|nr:hypothetical protein [Planctomycetaceae bacterium]
MSTTYLDPLTAPLESTEDAVFDKKLLVGTGRKGEENEQFDVRERFEENEQKLNEFDNLPGNISEINETLGEIKEDIEDVENEAKKGIDDAKAVKTSLDSHISAPNIHLPSGGEPTDVISKNTSGQSVWKNILSMLPENAILPQGGVKDDVPVKTQNGSIAWKAFNDLLPQKLKDILAAGGVVSADDVISAFQQITVTSWALSGLPLRVTRISAAVFAYDRFVVGGNNGQVASSFGATWTEPVTLFDNAAVGALVYDDSETGALAPLIALDAYSDFRISMNRTTWSKRLSVLVEKVINPDGSESYKDRYETADFTAAVANRGLYVLFTSKGVVYRATKEAIVAEYERATAPPEIDDNGSEIVFDRHSTIWDMQTSDESITRDVLDAAAGGIYFVTVGTLGKTAVSQNADTWESANSTSVSVFGANNINSVAAGFDRFMAVGDAGKIGYALFTSPKQWIPLGTPFGNESLRKIIYGSNIWLVVSESGNVKCSRNNGETWETLNVGMQSVGGTALAFGDTYFIIGDEIGNVRKSLSVASIFAVVTRSEFAALSAEILGLTQSEIARVDSWIANYTNWFSQQLERIDEALSYQLTISDEKPLSPVPGGSAGTLTIEVPVLDEHGNPVLDDNDNPITITKPQNKTVAWNHQHNNLLLALLEQLHRATIPAGYDAYGKPIFPQRSHLWGIPILDLDGKIFAQNQTWQRGQANGLAPLDENGMVPANFLAAGWLYSTLIQALRDQMLLEWTILPNTTFQGLEGYSRINAFAKNETTIVAVGEKGRIAWGPNVNLLQLANSPFGANDSLVGVACGVQPNGVSIFVAVSKTHYSTSYNGSEWSEPVELSDGIQTIFYGGGYFLISDTHGNIWYSEWIGNILTFSNQGQDGSSVNITQGIMSFAYLQDEFIGVGVNNKIVKATNPKYWNEDQSLIDFIDTQWNSVFVGDGFFVAVGSYGRAVKRKPNTATWQKINTGTTIDLHGGIFESRSYIIFGKNGIIRTSSDTDVWVARNSKTTSTIRSILYVNERYLVGSDTGQFIVSRSVYDVMYLNEQKTGTGPSNDDPNPLGTAYPGDSNNYMRANAVIPDTGVVMEKRVGKPTTYKTVETTTIDPNTLEEIITQQTVVDRYGVPPLNSEIEIDDIYLRWRVGSATVYDTVTNPDTGENVKIAARWGLPYLGENGVIPDEQIAKKQPNGVAPLDGDRHVPKEFLPPMEVNIEQIINVINGGHGLEFLEQISPFPQGIGVSAILHDGTFGNGVSVLVGETGIGYCEEGGAWTRSATQPFGNVPAVGAAFGKDEQDQDIFVSISTTNRISLASNGKEWSVPYAVDERYDFEAICYYNRTFLILCSDGEVLRLTISNNNINYDEQGDTPNITAYCNDIEGGNGIIVVVGNTGHIRVADDASHFSVAESPTEEDLLTVIFAKGTFLIGGRNNTLIIGTKKTDFHKIVSPFTGNAAITGTGYDAENGIITITNENGEVATTSNFADWSRHVPQPTNVRIKAIVTGNNRIFLGDDYGNIFASRVSIEIKYPEKNEDGNCECEGGGNGNGNGGGGGTFNGTIAWENVTEKPETFPPSAHTHNVEDITNFAETIAEYLEAGEIVVTAKSAYQSWLEQDGNANKTEAEFVQWLKGENGKSAYQSWLEQDGNANKTEAEFFESLKGSNGESAYQSWLEQDGNEGKTEAEFFESLKGENGKSAYQEWIENGNEGKTEAEFFESLKGSNGESAYQSWLEQAGNSGKTKAEFIESLKGENGVSAYGVWLAAGYEGTLVDFIESLKGDKGEPGATQDLSDYATKNYVDTEIEKIQHPETGGGAVSGGGGFRQIFVDKTNGNDNNDGLSTETAYQSLYQCELILQTVKNAEIQLLHFDNSSALELTGDGTADIIFVGNITINHILLNGFRSVQFKGTITTSSTFLINCNNVRFYNTVDITATANSPESIYIESTNAYFQNIVILSSSIENIAVTFVGIGGLSIVRFKELVIEDIGLNENSQYYKIETGSEVYVAGKAKHPNPYTNLSEVDPGEGAPLIDGHLLVAIEGNETDTYILPTGEQ